MSPEVALADVLGAGQLSVLIYIAYELGTLKRAFKDLRRRIKQLEQENVD